MSQDIKRQTECEKSPGRREEQCLSNTERVASHICPCRVCEGEREREREGGCSGHSSFSLGRPCPLRFIREKFPKSHLSVFMHVITVQLNDGTCWNKSLQTRAKMPLQIKVMLYLFCLLITAELYLLMLHERTCPRKWRVGRFGEQEEKCPVSSSKAVCYDSLSG